LPFQSRALDEHTHYLAIASMPSARADLRRLRRSIRRMRDADGIVLDLRGNAGGSRDVILELVPQLMPDGSPPLVASIAALRGGNRDSARADGELADRGMFPEHSSRFDDAGRTAISLARGRFAPQWMPASDEFGTWQFLLIRAVDRPALAGARIAV